MRPIVLEELSLTLQLVQKVVDMYHAGDEKYSHLVEVDMKKVSDSVESTSKWLQETRTKLASCPRQNNPPVTATEIRQERTVSKEQLLAPSAEIPIKCTSVALFLILY